VSQWIKAGPNRWPCPFFCSIARVPIQPITFIASETLTCADYRVAEETAFTCERTPCQESASWTVVFHTRLAL
jgi:hypothetical protein